MCRPSKRGMCITMPQNVILDFENYAFPLRGFKTRAATIKQSTVMA